jgi:rfaE bifunctional protein kinase chain/domain
MNGLPAFEGKKIVVIGDIMLDQYIFGSVKGVSPEAPVPVVEWKNLDLKAGGAANVALNVKGLGAKPILVSVIGTDSSGDKLLEVLGLTGLSINSIIRDDQRKTTVKTRVIADRQHLLRLDEEEINDIHTQLERKCLDTIIEIVRVERPDAFLIEDYNKGLLTKTFIETILTLAKKEGIFVAVDPKFRNFENYRCVDLLKPNLKEVNQFLKSNFLANTSDMNSAAQLLIQKLNYKNLLVTLGDKGIFINNSSMNEIVPAKTLDIVDVCGAGDAVISLATLCLISGLSLEDTAHWSNRAGAYVCQHLGVISVDKDQL